MSGISRIGSSGVVSRETPSSGHEAVDRTRDPRSAETPRNVKVDEVAKLYEKQFLREMVKAMRGTVSFSDVTKPSMAENIYREQLDSEYVESWGDNGGIGLSELIYNQLMERFFDSPNPELAKQGPISLSDRDVLRVARVKSETPEQTGRQAPLRIEVKASESGGAVQVKTPWDADVVSQTNVDGKTAVSLLHSGGTKSTFIFDGVPSSNLVPGQKIGRGHTIGLLSPEINSFFWNLSHGPGRLDSGPGMIR